MKQPSTSFLLVLHRVSVGFAFITALSACTSLTPIQEDPGPPPKVSATGVDAQDYITKVDLARVKLGMSADEVKNRIGSAMLGEPNSERWDYIVKEGRAAAEQYNTWAVYFKQGKVVQIAQVQNTPAPTTDDSMAASTQSSALPLLAHSAKNQEGGALAKSNAASHAVKPTAVAKTKSEFKPDPKPEVKPETGLSQEDPTAEIGTMLRAWVQAWSGKKTNTYLSFYADNFKHGMASRSDWVAQRRSRLSIPGAITLDLSAIQVTLINAKQAEVKFVQRYKSANFNDQGKKRMLLVRQGNAWKILEESFDN